MRVAYLDRVKVGLVAGVIFSHAWAVRPPRPAPEAPLTAGRLLALSAVVAAGSFMVRGWFPLNTSGWAGLHLGRWVQYLALFGLNRLSSSADPDGSERIALLPCIAAD